MKIVDPHFHLWDLERHPYPWLRSPNALGLNGDYSAICRTYTLRDFRAESEKFDVVKSIHVQAEISPELAVQETEWLQQVADLPGSGGAPNGIVAFCDLSCPNAEQTLEGHCQFANTRGIRQILNTHDVPRLRFVTTDYLAEPRWLDNFSLLKKFDLLFDLQIYPHQMVSAAALARKHPSTPIVLNHAGMPHDQSERGLETWWKGMAEFLPLDNVWVKISGLGMLDHSWTEETIRPIVRRIVEGFGPSRCMFASNFPVDGIFSTFDQIWSAFDNIVRDASASEREKLFVSTAEDVYRI